MSDATTAFFADLDARGHEPMLGRITGTVGFELSNGKKTDHWRISIRKGALRVTEDESPADCVIHSDRVLFNEIASGHANAFAAVLRGAVSVDGDPELLIIIQRLFPGPPPADPSLRQTKATGAPS
jgi:putative sterol carrier protein